MSIEVLVKVLMDEQSEWEKVRDELRVMLTTMFTFTTHTLQILFMNGTYLMNLLEILPHWLSSSISCLPL